MTRLRQPTERQRSLLEIEDLPEKNSLLLRGCFAGNFTCLLYDAGVALEYERSGQKMRILLLFYVWETLYDKFTS